MKNKPVHAETASCHIVLTRAPLVVEKTYLKLKTPLGAPKPPPNWREGKNTYTGVLEYVQVQNTPFQRTTFTIASGAKTGTLASCVLLEGRGILEL